MSKNRLPPDYQSSGENDDWSRYLVAGEPRPLSEEDRAFLREFGMPTDRELTEKDLDELETLVEEQEELTQRYRAQRLLKWAALLFLPVVVVEAFVSGIVSAATGVRCGMPLTGGITRLVVLWAVWTTGSAAGIWSGGRHDQPGRERGAGRGRSRGGVNFRKVHRN
jgi:hypothetical protein